MAMSAPLRSALAQVRRAAVDAPAQTTALELLQLAAAATSGTPVDLHRDVQLAAEEAIRMLRVSGNASPMRAAASALVDVKAEADELLIDLTTLRLFARAIKRVEEKQAQYTEPAALLAALRGGDVLLLSARWLMARAGYEEVEMEGGGSYRGESIKVKKWLSRREAQPLPCRQQIEAEHTEAILPADELERLHAQLTRTKQGEIKSPDALPIVSVSHCWEGREEPDPEARTLRTVAEALAGEWKFGRCNTPTSGLPLYARWGFEDVGVFFDFASLYQNKPQPRTAEQDAAFKRALGGMSMWYALEAVTAARPPS